MTDLVRKNGELPGYEVISDNTVHLMPGHLDASWLPVGGSNVKGERGRHPIVLCGHEEIDKSTDLEYIQASRKEVASSLDDFLRKFLGPQAQ